MADYNIQLHGPSTSTGSPSNDNLYPVTKAGIVLEVPTGSGTTDLASWATTVKVKKELIYSSTDTTVVPSSDINSYDHFEFVANEGTFWGTLKSGYISGGILRFYAGYWINLYGYCFATDTTLTGVTGYKNNYPTPSTSPSTATITAIYGIKY